MIKKVDLQKVLLFCLTIAVICIMKNICINPIDCENYVYFVRLILIFWDQSQILNLIWLLPIMLSINVIANKYFHEMYHFDTRYSNRKRFINKLLIKCILFSLIFNFIIAILQVIILTLITKPYIMINIDIVTIIIQYIVESTFLNTIIILFAMNIKNFMFTYIIAIIFIIISLTSIINLSLVEGNPYLPFINMYYSNEINVISILLTVIAIFFIKKLYIRCDILGGVDQ